MRKNASLQVIPPCSFDDALTSGGRMVVQFASCAAQLTGSCALADTVFNGFAKEVPEGVICAHCSDSSKSGIDPLPLLPPLFAVYDNGKVVGYCNGFTTSSELTKLMAVKSQAGACSKVRINRLGLAGG